MSRNHGANCETKKGSSPSAGYKVRPRCEPERHALRLEATLLSELLPSVNDHHFKSATRLIHRGKKLDSRAISPFPASLAAGQVKVQWLFEKDFNQGKQTRPKNQRKEQEGRREERP